MRDIYKNYHERLRALDIGGAYSGLPPPIQLMIQDKFLIHLQYSNSLYTIHPPSMANIALKFFQPKKP